MGWYATIFSKEYQVTRANYDARIRNWDIEYSDPFFIVKDSDGNLEFVFYDGKIGNCSCEGFIKTECSSCMHIEAVKLIPYWEMGIALEQSKIHKKNLRYIDFTSRQIVVNGKSPLTLPSVKLYENYRRKIKIEPYDITHIQEWDVFKDFGVSLYKYQLESVRNMLSNRRTVLTLKMGLGKTICALTCCKLLEAGKILIIAPNNLKYQWKSEIDRFSLGSSVVIDNKKDLPKITDQRFVILSYEMLNRNLEYFQNQQFDILIADEIQKIKNPDSISWKTMSNIKANFIFALSGTPIQNSIEDILSIVRFLNPNEFLPQWKFYTDYCDFSRAKLLGIRRDRLPQFKEMLSRYIINPTVSNDAIKLPKVNEKLMECELDPDSANYHNSYIEQAKPLLAKSFNYPLNFAEKARLNSLLTMARMSATDSRLLNPENQKSERLINIELTIQEIIQRGEKVVVYSEWIRATELLIDFLKETNIGYSVFNGTMTAKKRNSELNSFITKDEVKVFLSTDSGGLGIDGLQLTANNVIHVEKLWNPAKIKQRNGRLVRNLQRKDIVNIYNFTCNSEIERMMDQTTIRKEIMVDDIML